MKKVLYPRDQEPTQAEPNITQLAHALYRAFSGVKLNKIK